MSGTAILFLLCGIAALIAGVTLLGTAIRGKPGESPRHAVMLLAGMMAAAFGLLMGAFAIGSSISAPSDAGASQ